MSQEANDSVELNTIALLGSYVPRRCGIGTFTKDLRDGIAGQSNGRRTLVLAMDDVPEGYAYPPEVEFQIQAHLRGEYLTAADMLNINQVDTAILQHEYGIFGGPDGSYVLDFAERLRMPIITTLHTVLQEPNEGQLKVMRQLAGLSDRLVVMSKMAIDLLVKVNGVPREKIALIPHGIPDVPFVDPVFFKDQFGLEGRRTLLTFGLLSPGKGIEIAVQALPKIAEKFPDVVYVVLGATHPHILKREGNAYRHSLERLAAKLGVTDHLVFHNRFVSIEELCGYIGAADVYLSPYPNAAQIVSGTLAYAMGAGKAVVSTPYWYAAEMLAEERGRLVPFGDSERFADEVIDLLEDDMARNAIRKRAYMEARNMVWNEVAAAYVALAETVVREHRAKPLTRFNVKTVSRELEILPDVDLRHLRALTDDTGILQHAICAIPDRGHGYCTDDNARALIVALRHYDLYKNPAALPLISTYLSFLQHAFNPDNGRFRNFMTYDRRWREKVGSQDSHGRALWGLGIATALAPNNTTLSFAMRLFHEAMPAAEQLDAGRSWAFSLLGIHAFLRRFDGDTVVRRTRGVLAERLFELFQANATDDWPWFEDTVTYANAMAPHALILSGQWLPNDAMIQQGLRSLEWLSEVQTESNGVVSLIGNHGWMTRDGHRAYFDQQPIEAMAMVEACAEAYRCTQDGVWRQRARTFLDWFLGNNTSQYNIYDFETGGCRDGLGPSGPSLNEGAESTLAWLIAALSFQELMRLDTSPTPPVKAAAPPTILTPGISN